MLTFGCHFYSFYFYLVQFSSLLLLYCSSLFFRLKDIATLDQPQALHCRYLVPGNTQKILTEIWHHFWLKMMVKSGLEKNILKFNGGLQSYLLTYQANSTFLGRFFCTGQQQLWRPSWNFKIFFSRPLFTIIFKPKMVSNLCKNFLCIVWHQKPTLLNPGLFNPRLFNHELFNPIFINI